MVPVALSWSRELVMVGRIVVVSVLRVVLVVGDGIELVEEREENSLVSMEGCE